MSRTARQPERPWWVRLMLTGAPGRRTLRIWVALYLLAAVASVLYAVWLEDDLTFGVAFAVVFVALAVA
ncbi:MAG TPA: hypothetical protein VMP67_12950, partial [Candidatus Limnocylindria bacterium]|nr:hypothetical protein [Candidatus Limnocylindria bacterium]